MLVWAAAGRRFCLVELADLSKFGNRDGAARIGQIHGYLTHFDKGGPEPLSTATTGLTAIFFAMPNT